VSAPTLWETIVGWLAALPVRLAYRIIWLTAKLGSRNARDVQRAMWDAGLSIPPLTAEQRANASPYDGEHCTVCHGASAYPQCDEC
jgi:hypothetical protein